MTTMNTPTFAYAIAGLSALTVIAAVLDHNTAAAFASITAALGWFATGIARHERDAILNTVKRKYLAIGTVTKVTTSRKIAKRGSSVGLKK